jgi:uncharacterized protein (TIGR00251 family)
MLVDVKIKPNAKKSEVSGFKEGALLVSVKEQPIEGKANKAMIELLAKKLRIAKSCIELKKGSKSKLKRIEIDCIDEKNLKKILGVG